MQSRPVNNPAPPTRPEAQLPDDDPVEPKARRRRPLRLLSTLAGLVVVIALAQTPPGHSFMRLTGLSKPPTQYTALYFTDPGGLPATVASGHVALDVSFDVHNAAQSAASYQWVVRFQHGSKTQLAARGTVTVPGGDTKTESSSVSTVCQSGSLDVVVSLAAPSESIHFTAACGG
jgi:hypothetical protein